MKFINLVLCISSHVLFIFISNNRANAQVLSMDSCIEIALRNNIELKIQDLTRREAQVNYDQTKFNFLPTVNANSELNYNIGYSISPLDFSFLPQNSIAGNAAVTAQLTLFQGFQNWHLMEKMSLNKEAAFYQKKILENNIRISVMTQYVQVLLETDVLNSLQQQLESMNTLYKMQEELERKGIASSSTLLELRAQKEADMANVRLHENQLKSSKLRLKLMIGLPMNDNLEIDTSLMTKELASLEVERRVHFDRLESHPEIGFENLKNQMSTIDKKISKSSYYPTLSLGYLFGSNFINLAKEQQTSIVPEPIIGYLDDGSQRQVRSFSSERRVLSENNIPILRQLNDNNQHQFQLTLQIPVFDKWKKRTSAKLAEITEFQQVYKAKLVEQKVREKYLLAHNNVINSKDKYNLTKYILSTNLTRYNIAQEKLKYNLISYIQLYPYQQEVQKARLELSRTKCEWYLNYKLYNLF